MQAHCIYNNLSETIQATATNSNFNEFIGSGTSSCCSWENNGCNPGGTPNNILNIRIEIASAYFLTVIEVPANGDIYIEYFQEVVGGTPQIVCKSYNSNNTLFAQVPFLSSPGQSRNVKFLATSDPQFDVNNDSEEEQSFAVLNAMKQTLNNDSQYRGMLISGDLSENTTQEDFDLYKSQLAGYEHLTYDGFGNHDLYNHSPVAQFSCQNGDGFCVTPKTIIEDLRQRKRSSLIEYTNIPAQLFTYQNAFDNTLGWEDVEPPHYSWDWGDVHFLQLNLYPGTGTGKQEFINNAPHYFTPMKSLEYAINDLENNVGNSCRPVVLIFHFTINTPLWTSAEKLLIWNALANYNIALVITGHKNNVTNWVREWNRPSGTNLGPNSITEMVAGTAHLDGRYNDLQIQGNNLSITRWEVDDDDGEIELIGQYSKTITVGIDNDGDGFCISEDCNDFNSSVPAIPGSSCNDGDSNTSNDLIQPDGCTCLGTPSNGGNCTASFSGSNNVITILNLTAGHQSVKIFDSNWTTVFDCFDNCPITENIPLENGTFFVRIEQWTANWQPICIIEEYITLEGSSGCTPGQACNDNNICTTNDILDNNCNCNGTPSPDNDNDGFCAEQDCNDFNPNIPAAVGTSCDDNNPNTNNDLILADGCTCLGTPTTGGGCTAEFSGTNNSILITGMTAPNQTAKVFDANFNTIFECFNNCNASENIVAPNGTYYVSIDQWTASWQPICTLQDYVSVGGGSPCTPGQSCDDNNNCTTNDSYDNNCNCSGNPMPDNDGDGFCASEDCNDFNASVPAAEGTTCNDNNTNTINDIIQSDGCTCQGTPITGSDCTATFSGTNNSVLLTGMTAPNQTAKVFDVNFNTVFECFNNCNPTENINVPNGSYYVSIDQWTSTWQPICTLQDYVTVGGNTGCTPGQSCDDNNDCTYNDSYDNNCNCIGLLSPDNDNDGFCSLMDCNDFNPGLPATPGTSCNDNDPNTDNDVILEDGCSCAGIIGGGSSCNILVTSQGNTINVSGYSEPNAIIQVFTNSWSTVFDCSGDQCSNPQIISGLNNGSYFVKVTLYSNNWVLQCEELETVNISAGFNLQGDGSDEFLFFSAAKNGRETALNWTCNTDFKTDYFQIEHSKDGKDFETLETIESAGDTDRTVYYQSKDKSLALGRNYYRLAQVYKNGAIRYSTIKEIIFDMDLEAVIIFPNPTDYFINVNLKPFIGEALSVNVFNTLGQQMAVFTTKELQDVLVRFDLANYKPGVYLMVVELGNGKRVNRLFTVAR